MPLTSEHNKLLKLNELDKPQLPNKRSNNKHLSHNLNKGAIEIVVKHALQVLHHFVEGSLDIALD